MADFRQAAQGEAVLWRWSLDLAETEVSSCLALLSEEEKEAYGSLATARLKERYVAGRAVVRRVLGGVLDEPPSSLRFEYQAAGKPVLADHPGLHFNLSHSGGEALLAVARSPIGVDLERRREVRNEAALVKRWFSVREQAIYATTAEEQCNALFFRLWTSKEAIVKLAGGSLGEVLREIEPPVDSDQGEALLPCDNPLGAASCWVTRLDVGEGWSAALATLAAPSRYGPCRRIVLRDGSLAV